MKREEALQHFEETYLKEKSNQKLFALEDYYQSHKNELAVGFIESFRKICIKIKEQQSKNEKGGIGYITYSMLRTSILERKPCYLIEAFNEDWFLDFNECHGIYDAGWAFGFLDELEEELKEKAKLYFGSITAADVENVKMAEAKKYDKYIVSLARYTMPELINLKEYQDIEKQKELNIRVGEYRDISESVYKLDTREKDIEEVRDWLSEKEEDEYAYEVFNGLDLSKGNYKGINFSYSDFIKSNLSGSDMTNCCLIGTRFDGGVLDEVDFSYSFVNGASFSGCSLKGAVFHDVSGNSGIEDKNLWKSPGFEGASFEGADIEGADFRHTDLKDAVFIGANLKDVNFIGANLQNAVFLEKDRQLLDFSEDQIKTIQWKR